MDGVKEYRRVAVFGLHPDRVFPLLKAAGVLAIQGNYDESLAHGKSDCGCGYTDPRDNYLARVSYEYTFCKTSPSCQSIRTMRHWRERWKEKGCPASSSRPSGPAGG